MMEWRRGNQDLRSQGLDIQRGRAIVSGAQGQARLDQADTRIANSQANAQAAQQIRRQALQQTKDMGEQRMIQTATNSDIHAAATLTAGSGIPYPKALAQIRSGRGAAEEDHGLTPGTTTGTAPDQNKPSLSSIFGQ
jgi:multidrug resistance efflux pump